MTAIQDRHEVKAYVDAGGVHTYYEAEGTGEPLVLLHGGLCTIETFDGIRSTLAQHYRVYLPERRGTGRTPDVDGPITYELMAQDTIAFLEAIGLDSANVLGFSDGATVGLLVALRRPDLVRKLVFIGGGVNHAGDPPEAAELLKLDRMPDDAVPSMLRDLYAGVSPDGPEHWDIVVDKTWQMLRREPNIELEELKRVLAPTLLVFAEHDFVTIEFAEEVRTALPDARLVVVPDATHALPMEKPQVVSSLALEFLGSGASPN